MKGSTWGSNTASPSRAALSEFFLYGTSATQAGRNALKAALPALTIHG